MKARIMGKIVEIDEGRVAGTHKGSGLPKGSQGGRPMARQDGRIAGQETAQLPPSQSFFIPGQLPGLNEIIEAAKVRRGAWSKYGDMKDAHSAYIVTLIRQAKLEKMDYISVSFEWVEPTRKRDKDNIAAGKKFILDAMKAAGVIANDGWKNIESLHDTFTVDRANPGVKVVLTRRG